MPEAMLGGTRTYWRRWGRAERRALMIHCTLAHCGAWSGVAERLASKLTLQAFDIPGHGHSGPWDKTRDIQDQTFSQALALALPGPVDLIGHSFGATVCLRLAEDRPDLVRSLTLVEPVLFAILAEAQPRLFVETKIESRALEALIAAGEGERAARKFVSVWGTGARWETLPGGQRAYIVERIGLLPAEDASLYDDRAGVVHRARLAALRAPVLLVGGERSPAVSRAILSALARSLPGARRVTIAGAGHMAPVTHPEPVARAIAGFLNL